MQNRYSVPAAVAIAVFLAGCSQAPPPAPDTREKDAKAIHDLESAWVQAYATRDMDKIGLYYTDDASVFMTGSPVITGNPAIRAALKPMVADKNFSITFASDKVEVSKAADIWMKERRPRSSRPLTAAMARIDFISVASAFFPLLACFE